MKTSNRTRALLGIAGLLALAGAVFLKDQERVLALPYVAAFEEFPPVLRLMTASARWGLIAVCVSLLFASLCWKRISHPWLHPDETQERPVRYTSWALFLVTFFIYILVERLAFLDYPLTPDEYAYLYQARIFARGEWTAPSHPLHAFFRCAFIAEHEGRLFSIMPVGWSLLLVPGLLLGIPWVLSPLFTALGVSLTYQVGRSLYGHRAGLLAAILMSVSPFVVFHAGTYLPHQAGLAAFMAFLLLFIRMERGEAGTCAYVLLGCITAAIPLIHQLELFMLLPFFLVFAFRFFKGSVYPRHKLILAGVICVVLFFSFTAWHHDTVTGSPTQVPFKVYVDDDNYLSEGFLTKRAFGIHSMFALKQRVTWTIKRVLAFNYCLFPLAPIFIFLAPFLHGRRRWDFLLLGSAFSLWTGYTIYNSWGGVQFGPRYYFPSVGIVCLLIAVSFLRLASRGKASLRRGLALLLVLVCVYSIGLSALLVRFVPDVVRNMRIVQNAGAHLAEQGIHDSVLLLYPYESELRVEPNGICLRIRNSLDFDEDNLVAADMGRKNGELMAFYPERRFFRYRISMEDLVRGRPMSMEELNREDYP
jgi:4-amino-4-deoxy-L-arabinose transferase-like glycosyltransferase